MTTPARLPDRQGRAELRAVRVAAAGLWSAPDAPREQDAAVLGSPVSLRDWLDGQDPPTRRQLRGRLESQILLGDVVRVDAEVDGWAKVVAPSQPSHKDSRGYPGWIPLAQLATPAVETGARVVVTAPATDLLAVPDGEPVVVDVSFGTILPEADRVAGWVQVNLPADGRGWLPETAVASWHESGPLPTGDEFVALARRFVGVGFLPGGIHGLGFDCSGLIHQLYRRFGQSFPRDTEDAFDLGEDVPVADLQPGDIVYFMRSPTARPHHCGINTGPGSLLHTAQSAGGCVDGGPIDQQKHVVGGRRLLSPADRPSR